MILLMQSLETVSYFSVNQIRMISAVEAGDAAASPSKNFWDEIVRFGCILAKFGRN